MTDRRPTFRLKTIPKKQVHLQQIFQTPSPRRYQSSLDGTRPTKNHKGELIE